MGPDRSRDEWLAYADRLLAGARRWASPNHARITPPGAEGGYGRDVDGLEGFARTFLLAGFRIAGARGEGLDALVADYRRGIVAGVDPAAPDRWVRLDEHPQAKVEAASLALILDLTRPWLWDTLDPVIQERVVDYLAPAVGDHTYPRNNWLWFRLVVQTFLRSVGGPWSAEDMAADLARHDSFGRTAGWLSDGDERSYDHYVGWALHLYPVLWSRMAGAADLAGDRTAADVAALDRFLTDALALVGADGAPLLQGRSLIYRFAAAAPFWAGVLAEVPSHSPGALRHAADRVVGHFAAHGAPDERDLLTLGWHHEWRGLAQSYSGPASPYWATKGLLGVALPADHPVWTAPAEPLPVERADTLRAVAAPGWLVAGTRADGVVRVINHGTDHAREGDEVADSPLYARLGYSTVTSPLLDEAAWAEPLEQSVALLDDAGRASHRAGMTLLRCEVVGEGTDAVGVAASRVRAHWVDPAPDQVRHGSGRAGASEEAGELVVTSYVRGPWEVRLVDVLALAPGATRLRVGGWATTPAATATLTPLTDGAEPATVVRTDAGPLGDPVLVPVLTFPARTGDPVATLVGLGRAGGPTGAPASASLVRQPDGQVRITWPDGVVTSTSTA